MPTGNNEMGKLYYEIDGELKPLEMGVSIEDCAEIISDADNALNNPEQFKGGEISFELTDDGEEQVLEFIKPFKKAFDDIEKLLNRTLLCNNWCKMHHLPLIRQRGKRE